MNLAKSNAKVNIVVYVCTGQSQWQGWPENISFATVKPIMLLHWNSDLFLLKDMKWHITYLHCALSMQLLLRYALHSTLWWAKSKCLIMRTQLQGVFRSTAFLDVFILSAIRIGFDWAWVSFGLGFPFVKMNISTSDSWSWSIFFFFMSTF